MVEHRQHLARPAPRPRPWQGRCRADRARPAPPLRAGCRGSRGRCCSRAWTSLPAPEPSSAGVARRQRRGRGRHRPELHALRPARRQPAGRRRFGRRRRRRASRAPPRPSAAGRRRREPAVARLRPAGPCGAARCRMRRHPSRPNGSAPRRAESKPRAHQPVPALSSGPPRAAASRTPPAGPRPGSAPRRAAGCAPPSAAAAPRRAAAAPAAQRTSLRGAQSGTSRPVAGSVAHRIGPSSGGSAVVSGRITSGACKPLAPCTVITRTSAARAPPASRFTSAPDRRSQCRKPCNDGGCRRA